MCGMMGARHSTEHPEQDDSSALKDKELNNSEQVIHGNCSENDESRQGRLLKLSFDEPY
jgi:hypothetical protein